MSGLRVCVVSGYGGRARGARVGWASLHADAYVYTDNGTVVRRFHASERSGRNAEEAAREQRLRARVSAEAEVCLRGHDAA